MDMSGMMAAVPVCLARCSIYIEARQYGDKAGGTIGALAGVTSGVGLALSGAVVGTVSAPWQVRSARHSER